MQDGRGATRERRAIFALIGVLAGLWAANATGIVASNDGSHVALARALGVRFETSIDPDWRLTVGVDLAERQGRLYSDRPPGTGFLAAPAAWLGARLDGPLLERSRAVGGTVVTPGSRGMRKTYAQRYPDATPLDAYQGTAWWISLHAVGVATLGLAFLDALLRLWGIGFAARAFAVATTGACTLFGPYATALFSHGTAASAMAALVYALAALPGSQDRARALSLLGGFAGAIAVAAEYSLVAWVPLAVLFTTPPRHWTWLAAGALPVALATGAYHAAAFGSPFSIGYHHHVTFDFSHRLSTTFGGDPLGGLWVLFGAGQRAGLLWKSPVVFVGIAALVLGPGRATDGHANIDRRTTRLLLASGVPWMLLLSFHETPWGGATVDYRYLIPALPLFGAGLALAWERWANDMAGAAGIVALALYSGISVWTRFLQWHGGPAFASPLTGLFVAALIAGAGWALAPRLAAVREGS
ncbi:MAG: hypothetical protein HRU01_13240 [Myxococcales bacterium]|nr:hypothetical protein [Myxococcales bacterium]